jgi:GPH family glycoside/pentoside/hexuronide:cation symporter
MQADVIDYDERTGLLALRDGMLLFGTVAAVVSPLLISSLGGLPDDAAGERTRFLRLALFYGPLVVALCLLTAVAVPERVGQARPSSPATLTGFRAALRNRPFAILLASYTIAAFGSNLPATLILFYVEYVLLDPAAEGFLLLYFVTGVALLPLWVYLARRVEKKAAWLTAMTINSGAFLGVFFLGPGQSDLYAVLVVLSGLGFGGTVAIPSSMQADVIDYDELLSGRRREGIFIGTWAIARKLAAAVGVGIALVVLGSTGYQPKVEQTPEAIFSLRVLYALVPSLLNLLAIGVALAYPIDRQRHQRILAAIELRREGGYPVDPLRTWHTLGDGA